MRLATACALAGAVLLAAPAQAAEGPGGPPMTPPQMMAAQKDAMAKVAFLDGLWRGTGSKVDRPGDTPDQMTMTARVGTALGGAIRVIEYRGYTADGALFFHTWNTLGYDPGKGTYTLNARAGGRSGDFSFVPADHAYVWDIGGGGSGIHYQGKVENGVWTETGDAVAPGREPQFMSRFEMRRVGDTDWPDGGAPRH